MDHVYPPCTVYLDFLMQGSSLSLQQVGVPVLKRIQ